MKLSERQMKLLEGIYIYPNKNGETLAIDANRESNYTDAGLKRTLTILEDAGLITVNSPIKKGSLSFLTLTEAGKEVIGVAEDNILDIDVESESIEEIWEMDIEFDLGEDEQQSSRLTAKKCTKEEIQVLIDNYHTFKPLRVRSERLIEMEKMINKHSDEHGYIIGIFIRQGIPNDLTIDKDGETLLDWTMLNNNEIYEKILGIYMISLDIDAGFIQFKTEEDAILEDILNKWKVYKASYILGVEYIVMDSEEAARDVALSLEPTYDELLSIEEVTEPGEIDEDLKITLVRGYKKGNTEFKVEREKNKIWNELLDEVLCYRDIEGNRPCDNGCICDRCSSNWFYEMYENKLINAGLYK